MNDPTETAKPKFPPRKKNAPTAVPPSLQFDLFTQFYGASADLSNTIELWDAVPKFAVSKRRQDQIRDTNGRLPILRQSFLHRPFPRALNEPLSCSVKIVPAYIETDDGDRDFYPSTDEELLDEVLRKIYSDQTLGMLDMTNGDSWVRFTLRGLQRELSLRGRTRSLAEIKRSLEILAHCVVTVHVSKGSRDLNISTAFLSDLTSVSRRDYEDGTTAWCARLPALVTKSIRDLSFRQFNYATLMSLDSQLARWFHKRLSHEYVNAALMSPYTILYSTIARDSALLSDRPVDNRKAVTAALSGLKERGVLFCFDQSQRLDGRKITDVLYTLTPSRDFVAEIKAANKRAADGHARAFADGLSGPWRNEHVRKADRRHVHGQELAAEGADDRRRQVAIQQHKKKDGME